MHDRHDVRFEHVAQFIGQNLHIPFIIIIVGGQLRHINCVPLVIHEIQKGIP